MLLSLKAERCSLGYNETFTNTAYVFISRKNVLYHMYHIVDVIKLTLKCLNCCWDLCDS